MSRISTMRHILAEVLRPYQGKPLSDEGPRVKFLISNAVVEGTLSLSKNPSLLSPSPYANGTREASQDVDAILITDVAIRPLDEPEVHVGLNQLHLFMESITGVIG